MLDVMTESTTAAEIFGNRVKDLRVALGLSQSDASRLAIINVSNFGKIERGVGGNPNLMTIIRIAGVLGVDPGELVTGIGVESLPEATRVYTAMDFLAAKAKHEATS